MAKALGDRMNLQADMVNPFEQVPVQPGATGSVVLEEAAPMLLLPLGLALRTL
jgi:Tfp pilus assembly PilM family ATPase